MKKLLFPLLLLFAGVGVGGGAAFATTLLMGPSAPADGESAEDGERAFVSVGTVLAPLVFPDGRLSGYMQFKVSVEAPQDKEQFVTARIPLLLHAINLRTFKTPMASGPDGMLPDIDTFRKLVEASAPEAFGEGVVDRVAVTLASPV